MASELFLLPFRPAFDANGIVVSGAKLYFYATGTTTPQAIYSDEALVTPLANPVEANAAGVWPAIYLDQALTYRVVLKNADGATLSDADPYLPGVVDNLAADVAADAAAAAASAAQAEVLATVIALIAAGLLFDDTTDGVAGVADGETFVTWEDERLRIYLRDGSSAVFKAEIATQAMLESLAAGVGDDVFADVVASLALSSGSASVGFIHSLTNAVARTVQSKLRDTVSPEDFGAVGDGVADDTTAVVNAINSGRMVDGNGRTYALGTPVVPGGDVKGIRNCNFKWANTTAMAGQQFMLSIIDKSNIIVDNLVFDLGTVEDCGSDDDSGRGALKISTSSEGVTWNDYLTVRNIRVFGKGNGTGIYIRSFRYSTFDGLTVHDREVSASPDPTNDCQNGIDLSIGKSSTVSNVVTRDQTTRLSGTLVKRYSRGILHFELQDCAMSNYAIENVDQGFDLSGAITATLTQGNVGLSLSSMSATGCNTYGFKFANCSHDIAGSGLVARAFGFVGFVFSGPTSVPLDATKNTQRIVLTGCHAFDPTGSFSANCYGFRLMQAGTAVGYPRGIRLVGCTVSDVTGGGKLYQGFNSDVTYDSSGHLNELIECRSFGHTDAADAGFTYTVAQLPSSAPVGSRMIVTDANSVTFGSTVAGGGSLTTPVYRTSGDWKVG